MKPNKFTIQKSFAINAGAGSGKTYTLSRRYINALLGFDYFREDYKTQKSYFGKQTAATVNQIVTITYTEAAALEMKGRIFELVSKILHFNTLYVEDDDYGSIKEANANITEDERSFLIETLKKAYQDSGNSRISTIHSYCLNIIKANADIARMDTKLDIIKDDEKASVLEKIVFEVLDDENNRKLVLDISENITTFFFNNLIARYVSSSKFRKDYDNFDKDSIDEQTYKALIQELYPLPDFSEVETELQDDKTRDDWFAKYYQNFLDFNALPWSKAKEGEKAPNLGIKFPNTTEIRDIMGNLEKHYAPIDTDKERLFFEKTTKIKSILYQIKSKYDNKLKELGKIDFDTIIFKTLELIKDVKTDFRYIMVDEFQDTNEVQFDIVKNSCNSKTNLFVVGDSKQSIYSFQGAEIEVFNQAISDKKLFSSIEDMSKNHRSDGVVLKRVNEIFEKLLEKDDNLKQISQNYEAEAQNLEVFKKKRADKGSFKYLITSQPYQEEVSELDSIVSFVSDIYYAKNRDYEHITTLIDNKKDAIAIVFDSSTKMLELKQKLRERGITAKVSTSDNFYYTKEVNDICNLLKAIDILSTKKELKPHDHYYLVGAMRSNILRLSDNEIKEHIEEHTIPQKLEEYRSLYNTMTLARFVKHIYDDSDLLGVYTHFEDIEQRVANLYKFLNLCTEYQNSNETNLYKFLKLIENSIYFSEAKEDEAFFKSDNTKSIQICSIHSTKGLSYPLVLLGNSDKGLYSQITSDPLKHNNFTLNGVKKEIVGFKINEYVPLSHRVLKQVDKLKHLAEKKRLLYVALTRAEHDVVVSAHLKEKKEGDISLRDDSYLKMITSALDIEIKGLYEQDHKDCIKISEDLQDGEFIKKVEHKEHSFKPIEFEVRKKVSATATTNKVADKEASKVGTITHKIIELYWDSFEKHSDIILDKMMVFDKIQRENVKTYMSNFYKSDVYKLLKKGVNYKFELEFNEENRTGFIDFIYFDEKNDGWVIVDFKTGIKDEQKIHTYQSQLDFYKTVIENLGYKVIKSEIMWLS